ncbi:hypothetical protein MRS60_20140 [Burkholderia pyrrocinia]|nr:hypothetical protein [Burkholderia pyrrocinia]UOB59092.1 hypothetical protein MRS60_20140 [Burkholderia pyrrocinia]
MIERNPAPLRHCLTAVNAAPALAASAASVEHPGTALCTRADVERIHVELVAEAT